MKIVSVKIENFRCLKNEVVNFDDYTCLVGPNGAGKSTVLNALNVFFRESKSGSTNLVSLSKEDFHDKKTELPIRITVTFGGLSDAAKKDLQDYVRHDQLVVAAVATWNDVSQTAVVTQHGSRLAMTEFARYFRADADGLPVGELRLIYADIRKNISELSAATTKGAMADALRAYEAAHPEKCRQIESSDEFYGVSKGAHKLGRYVQWIFIPAVKDAASEQAEAKDTALGRLMERTVRAKVRFTERIRELQANAIKSYDALLAENQPALTELSTSLTRRLGDWSHRGAQLQVRWDKDPQKSVRIEEPFAKIYAGDEAFLGEVSRLGHGLQRSYMFALLQELSGCDLPDAPRLLLGIEEPELFQHPPQAQHLADVFAHLSTQNAQVFACTHSPYFVSGKGFENVRLVRATVPPAVRSAGITFKQLSDHLKTKLGEDRYKQPQGVRAKIHQALQPVLREMFFAPKLVLVEGLEDIAYITAALNLDDKWDTWRSAGCHLVPVNGKSELVQPLAIAQLLSIPVFVMFDADGDETNANRRNLHKLDNERLLKLIGLDPTQPFPAAPLLTDKYVVWVENLGAKIRADYTETEWISWKSATEAELGQPGGLEKNSLLIAAMMEKAWEAGKPSGTLRQLCERLLEFAG